VIKSGYDENRLTKPLNSITEHRQTR